MRTEIATAAIEGARKTAATLQSNKEGEAELDDEQDTVTQIMNQVIGEIQQVNHMIQNTKENDAIEIHIRLMTVRAERRKLYELNSHNKLSAELYAKILYELDLAETLLLGRSPIHPN